MSIPSKIPPLLLLRIINPLMRILLRSPLHFFAGGIMLLEFRGHKTGRKLAVPVSYHILDDSVTTFTGAPWLRNLQLDPSLQVTLKGMRHTASAEIINDPETVARAIERVLRGIGRRNAYRFAFKITGQMPSWEEVREALAGRKMLRLKLLD